MKKNILLVEIFLIFIIFVSFNYFSFSPGGFQKLENTYITESNIANNHIYNLYKSGIKIPIAEYPPNFFIFTNTPPYLEYKHNYCQKLNGWGDIVLETVVKNCINSDGIKGPEITVGKNESTFRIIALGDSITFGKGVSDNETWTVHLERMLNKESFFKKLGYKSFEVLNFGFLFFNTKQEIQLFEKKAPKYKPDLVIVQYMENDAINQDVVDQIRDRYIQQLSDEIPDKISLFEIASIQGIIEERSIRRSLPIEEEMKIVEESLDKLYNLSKKYEFKVLIMHYSTLFFDRHMPYLKNITTNKYGWYFMHTDLVSEGKVDVDKIQLHLNDFHLNSYGYGLTAREVLEFLIDNPDIFEKKKSLKD